MKSNSVERRIMWGDLDALGIVFYPRYSEWFDASAHLFFEAVDLSLASLWQHHHILFGLVEITGRYHRPGRYHDRIRIVTRIESLSEKTVTLRHTIASAPGGDLMVEGLEKRICLDVSDPSKFRAIVIPDPIHRVLRAALAD